MNLPAAAEGLGGDEPSTVFDFMWEQGAGVEPVQVAGLGMSIENLSRSDITVSVRLACHGLIDSHASLDLGAHRIGGGEILDLWAPAAALPIRSARMVSQARAEITAFISTPEDTVEQRDVSAEIYYRHLPGAQEMVVFSMRGLIDRYDGRVGPPIRCVGPADCRAIVLGRVADPSAPSGFRPVTAWDESLLKRDPQGRVVLRLAGLRTAEEWEARPWPPTCDLLGLTQPDEEPSTEDEDWMVDDDNHVSSDMFIETPSEVPAEWWPAVWVTDDEQLSTPELTDLQPSPPPLPVPAGPTGFMRFCLTWQSQYVDAGVGGSPPEVQGSKQSTRKEGSR